MRGIMIILVLFVALPAAAQSVDTIHIRNKKLIEVVEMSEGEKNGKAKVYTEDWKLTAKGRYENDKRQGNWKYYDKTGRASMKMKFIEGEVVKSRSILPKIPIE